LALHSKERKLTNLLKELATRQSHGNHTANHSNAYEARALPAQNKPELKKVKPLDSTAKETPTKY
jgi:hypothetical protein